MYTLRNPAAISTGHTHYVTYEPQTDGTVVVTRDDCVMNTIETMSLDSARADYHRRIALGYRA